MTNEWNYTQGWTKDTLCPIAKPNCDVAAHSDSPFMAAIPNIAIPKIGDVGSWKESVAYTGGHFGLDRLTAGPTPVGDYKATNCGNREDKGGIYWCDMKPIEHDARGRTALAVHEPSVVGWKSALHMDSLGCVVTQDATKVKDGDIIHVQRK